MSLKLPEVLREPLRKGAAFFAKVPVRLRAGRDWVAARLGHPQMGRARSLLLVLACLLALPVVVDFLVASPWAAGWRAWLSKRPVLGPLIFYDPHNWRDAPSWKDRATGYGLLVSAVVGYFLWHWRDVNTRASIENARKDVNLKEFQEIQMRAAGALDREKLGAEACDQLQIAALHQLRGFLRGEYGEAFRRPAFELLLAGHAAAMERNGVPAAIRKWAGDREVAKTGTDTKRNFEDAMKKARDLLSAVDRERLGILRDEAKAFWGAGFPLNGRSLDLVEWSGANLGKADLRGASLIGADLRSAHLEGANLRSAHLEDAYLGSAHLEGADLWSAHLEGADLVYAHLEGARLWDAYLEGANLRDAHLEGANLWGAHLEGANLRDAHLEGANLRYAHLEGADLGGAVFDDATRFTGGWDKLLPEERAPHQQRLRDLGARHVYDAALDDDDDIPF